MRIVIIGCGYVGLNLAVKLSKHFNVIGYDKDRNKVRELNDGIDRTDEVQEELVDAMKNNGLSFTEGINLLFDADAYIICVPTPVNKNNSPDLSYVVEATNMVAYLCKRPSPQRESPVCIIYESTFYPGTIDDLCIPIIYRECNKDDVAIGYSPERIDPGNKDKNITNIKKLIASSDPCCLEIMNDIYSKITDVVELFDIRTAEMSKLVENIQRDINIAFINEVSMICNKMNIDTKKVLKAANSKWNFLDFKPGLVGGHCISVDPFYLKHKSTEMGMYPRMISEARRLNEHMPKFITDNIMKMLIQYHKKYSETMINMLGITFKANVPDIRNTGIKFIYDTLLDYGFDVIVNDPRANPNEVYDTFRRALFTDISKDFRTLRKCDVVVIGVAHDEFKDLKLEQINKMFRGETKILIDIPGLYEKSEAENKHGIRYWSL